MGKRNVKMLYAVDVIRIVERFGLGHLSVSMMTR